MKKIKELDEQTEEVFEFNYCYTKHYIRFFINSDCTAMSWFFITKYDIMSEGFKAEFTHIT